MQPGDSPDTGPVPGLEKSSGLEINTTNNKKKNEGLVSEPQYICTVDVFVF